MLKSKSIWKEADISPQDSISKTIHPLIEQLLLKRKLATQESITEGLATTEGPNHDPFLFKEMEKSVERIKRAIESKEAILIYGDYDADGVTATSILVRCLKELGAVVDFYIPNRFYEGYGPNEDAFMQAVSDGFKVVITVDNGISGIQEADLLATHGVDLIITDHHQASEELPHAFSLIHPELETDYPFPYLAGAGVALKLAQGLMGESLSSDYDLIAAFGTIGDIVSLTDENRAIVQRGLKRLKTTKLPGVIALLEQAKVEQSETDESTVGYEICPRLNAPGRLDEASLAVELLISEDEEEAREIANQIENINQERKKLTQTVVEEAIKHVDISTTKKVIILYEPDWHEGILGIVAGKLAKEWQKAVFVLTADHEGRAKGSARAVEGYHLFDLLSQCEDLLEKFGGHALAAGLTLDPENIQALEARMNGLMFGQKVTSTLSVDFELPMSEAKIEFVEQLSCLAPFGAGNRPPIIKLANMFVKNVKRIGNKNQHLKFTIYNEDGQLEAIAFNQGMLDIYLTPESRLDFVGELNINEWNGRRNLQFRIEDVRCEEFQLIDLRNQQLFEQNKKLLQDAAYLSKLEETTSTELLVIDELPASKEELLQQLGEITPKTIVLAPYLPVTFATREKFVKVYQVLQKHPPFQVNNQIINYFERLDVTKNELLFILRVFFEIEIVIIKDMTVSSTQNVSKRDLSEAPTFRTQQGKQAMHEFLELSTNLELKTIFSEVVE